MWLIGVLTRIFIWMVRVLGNCCDRGQGSSRRSRTLAERRAALMLGIGRRWVYSERGRPTIATRDFGIGKLIKNLPRAAAGRLCGQPTLLDAQTASHRRGLSQGAAF